jgi:hypothetical protein
MYIRHWFENRVPLVSDSDPTSNQIQIDKMDRADFYEIFVMDMLDLEGLPLNQIPLQPAFDSLWDRGPNAEFKHVTIRELKSVDSKDKVRLAHTLSLSL